MLQRDLARYRWRPRTVAALTMTATVAAGLLVGTAPASATGGRLPDPTPHGPQRPHEADVEGTTNADSLDATMRTLPGTRDGVGVRLQRTSSATSGPAEKPAPARRFVIMFDENIRFNTSAFPTCSQEALRAQGPSACPAGSRIGSGTYVPWTPQSEPRPEPVEVFVFNGYDSGYPAMFVYTAGITLVQTLERVGGDYKRTYRWGLDEILPPVPDVPPLDRSSTYQFVLDYGATTKVGGKTVSFLTTTSKSSQTRYDFGFWTDFATGQVQLPTARVRLDRAGSR